MNLDKLHLTSNKNLENEKRQGWRKQDEMSTIILNYSDKIIKK